MIIYLLPLPDLPFSGCAPLLGRVSEKRREKIGRLRNDDARTASLFAALLARMAVSGFSGVPSGALSFDVSEKGKPYCLNAGCEFSVSHTKGMIVCAVSPVPVGADAELIKPPPEKVAKYFTEREREYIFSGGMTAGRFFRVWTRKEAYGKMTGEGIAGGALSADTLSGEFCRTAHSFVFGGHMISVCSEDMSSLCVTETSPDGIGRYFAG